MSALATVEQSTQNTGLTTPADLLRYAMESKAGVSYLRELMELQRVWQGEMAKLAFNRAMAEFKSETLEIRKDKMNSYVNKQNQEVSYMSATIGCVCAMISGRLGKFGLRHRWTFAQGDGGRITVGCVITHAEGHEEITYLSAGPDTSGGKSDIQAVASTVSYLERYTLLGGCGMATMDQEDDDGRKGRPIPGDAESDAGTAAATDWVAKIDGCASSDELEAIGKEFATTGAKGKTRAAVRSAYAAKRAALLGTAT